MRCISCDTLLTQSEMKMLKPITGHPEDMCTDCRGHAFDSQSVEEYEREMGKTHILAESGLNLPRYLK